MSRSRKSREVATPPIRRSWLIQRLGRPATHPHLRMVSEAFAFGGGLRDGGLSNEAMSLLREVFTFNYMGAAEFEYGAVPKALQAMAADSKSLTAWTFTIPFSAVAPNWRDKSPAPDGDATLYALARKGHAVDIEARIRLWASESGSELKEQTRLNSALRPVNEWDADVAGWLELDNGFFFFTDEQMWSRTCDLFGVKATATS